MHFKHPRVLAVNRMATRRTFREKKYDNNKADSFFRLNFNVYIDVKSDNTEKELEREIRKKTNTKETNFIGRKT